MSNDCHGFQLSQNLLPVINLLGLITMPVLYPTFLCKSIFYWRSGILDLLILHSKCVLQCMSHVTYSRSVYWIGEWLCFAFKGPSVLSQAEKWDNCWQAMISPLSCFQVCFNFLLFEVYSSQQCFPFQGACYKWRALYCKLNVILTHDSHTH